MLLSEPTPGVGHHQRSSPRTQVNFMVGLRAIACCVKRPLMVIFAIPDHLLVWDIHLSLMVKDLPKASHAGLVLTLCLVAFKTQAWSSSIKLWDEGRISGASSPHRCIQALLSPGVRAVPTTLAGTGMGKSPLERLSLVRGEGTSQPFSQRAGGGTA